MENFISENEYKKIFKKLPIFCIDFLIRYKEKYLLLKRVNQPMKEIYWVIGGRLRFRESLLDFAKRIQKQELGKYFLNYKLIGFSNYMFDNLKDSRATHTPTILFEIVVDEMFAPNLDQNHSDYIWSNSLPDFLKESTLFI
tara:strand:+ start:793 stop:1215 length:423 start_codon:yes stop_codon:yes gene_type:complete